MEIWIPQLTFTPQYFDENGSWVAVDGNRPIGFYTLLNKNATAWLENLWVLPEYMGKGIGRQLFLHAMIRAHELGFKTMQLEADPNALGFYEKMGMGRIGERLSEVDGQPRILPIMEIPL
jgi:ribosomal protein S18 acetylase RimI-like enzyme